MSTFRTHLPVLVAAVLRKLPKGHFVESIKLAEDKGGVDVIWGHDRLVTRSTHPTDFPPDKLDELEAGELPEGIGYREKLKAELPQKNAEDTKVEEKPLTKEQVKAKQAAEFAEQKRLAAVKKAQEEEELKIAKEAAAKTAKEEAKTKAAQKPAKTKKAKNT